MGGYATWDEAKKRADESSGGMFVSLKDDGDKAVGCFVGQTFIRDLFYDKKTENYEDYTDTHKAKGLPKSSRFLLNFWIRAERVCKILEMNGATFTDVIAVREKYGFEAGYAFEIQRHGKKKDPKTTYSILPEKEMLTAEEKTLLAAATLHDLAAARGGGESPATDMDSHDKAKAGAGTNGATNGTKATAPAAAPGADCIDVDTKNRLVLRLKQHERPLVDKFMAQFKITKMSQVKKTELAAVEAALDALEGKGAAVEVDDPFA